MPHARKNKSTPTRSKKGGKHSAVKNEAKVVAAAASAAVRAAGAPRSRSASRKAKHPRKGKLRGVIDPEVAEWCQMMLQPDVCLTDTNVKRLARLPDGESSAVLSCSGTAPAFTVPSGSVAIIYGVPIGEALRYSWLTVSNVNPGSGPPVIATIESLAPCAGFCLVVPKTWVDAAGMPPLHSPFSCNPAFGGSGAAIQVGSSQSPITAFQNFGGGDLGAPWDSNLKIYDPAFATQTSFTADARIGHRYMPLMEWVYAALYKISGLVPTAGSVLANMNAGTRIYEFGLSEGAAAFTMCCNVDSLGAPKEPDPSRGPNGLGQSSEQRACPARLNVMDMYWQGNPNYLTTGTVHGFSTQLGPGGLFGFETAFAYDGVPVTDVPTQTVYFKYALDWFVQTCCVTITEARQFSDKYQVMNLGTSGESGFHLCSDGTDGFVPFQPLGNPNNAFLTSAMFPAPSEIANGTLEDRLRKALDKVAVVDTVDLVDVLQDALTAPAAFPIPWTPGARDADLTREYLPPGQRLTFGLVYNNSTQDESYVVSHVAAFQFQCNRGMGLEERATTDRREAVATAMKAIRAHPVLVGPHSFGDWFKELGRGLVGAGREVASVFGDVGKAMWLGAKMIGKSAAGASMLRAGGRLMASSAGEEAALGALMMV